MTNWILKEVSKIETLLGNSDHLTCATGYGPSGLPHIGTFAEVYRTIMVMRAFNALNPKKRCTLYAFSDDLDGLRKVPDNVPNKDELANYIGVALTSIPDPFKTHESYGAHMNNKLRVFLDHFGFQYEFKSATECYKSGIYNEALLKILDNYEKIIEIVLPNIGEERAKTYSPFLPICPKSNKVLQVPIVKVDKKNSTISYTDEQGNEVETSVTDGKCKLQWRPDWGMRWAVFNIDYEMHGKDLMPSAKISSKICNVIGGKAPKFFCYELFLDEEGKKISKSKGNGLSIEDWLKYAPIESLKFYLLQDPAKARKLFFGMVPKFVDEYLKFLSMYDENLSLEDKIKNPIWYIDSDKEFKYEKVTFNMLLNLVSASNAENKQILWGFLKNYDLTINEGKSHLLNRMIECAVAYYDDFVKPSKNYYKPSDVEKNALLELMNSLVNLEDKNNAVAIQNAVLSVGKEFNYENLREWFLLIYKSLFGQESGPRMGTFIKIYGVENFVILIRNRLNVQ